MSNQTYSFLDVVASLVGPGVAVNLGNGAGPAPEGISFDPSADLDTMTIGADGSGMHTLHADKSGSFTVRLLKTSPTNKILSAAAAFQRTGGSVHGQNTLTIIDKNRGDVITGRNVAFARIPSVSYGAEAGVIEWRFNALQVDMALSSN